MLISVVCVSSGLLGDWATEVAKLGTCVGGALASGVQRFKEKVAKHPRHPVVLGWRKVREAAGTTTDVLSRTYEQALGMAARERKSWRGIGAQATNKRKRATAAQRARRAAFDAREVERLRTRKARRSERLRAAVAKIYALHRPQRLDGTFLPTLLRKWAGREAALVARLRNKYMRVGKRKRQTKRKVGEWEKKKAKRQCHGRQQQQQQAKRELAEKVAKREQARRVVLDECGKESMAFECEAEDCGGSWGGDGNLGEEAAADEVIDLDDDAGFAVWVESEAQLDAQLAAYEARAAGSAAAAQADEEHAEVLDVKLDATAEDLKRAFRRSTLAACPYYECDQVAIERLRHSYETLLFG